VPELSAVAIAQRGSEALKEIKSGLSNRDENRTAISERTRPRYESVFLETVEHARDVGGT
jgi:hypothetical protein